MMRIVTVCDFYHSLNEHGALNRVLMMDYLWSDLPVVQELLADTVVLLPTVIVEKLAWMTGCRRAWLAACVKKKKNI